MDQVQTAEFKDRRSLHIYSNAKEPYGLFVKVDNNQKDTRHIYEGENLPYEINGVAWIC